MRVVRLSIFSPSLSGDRVVMSGVGPAYMHCLGIFTSLFFFLMLLGRSRADTIFHIISFCIHRLIFSESFASCII